MGSQDQLSFLHPNTEFHNISTDVLRSEADFISSVQRLGSCYEFSIVMFGRAFHKASLHHLHTDGDRPSP